MHSVEVEMLFKNYLKVSKEKTKGERGKRLKMFSKSEENKKQKLPERQNLPEIHFRFVEAFWSKTS